jgi:hypothetical protein
MFPCMLAAAIFEETFQILEWDHLLRDIISFWKLTIGFGEVSIQIQWLIFKLGGYENRRKHFHLFNVQKNWHIYICWRMMRPWSWTYEKLFPFVISVKIKRNDFEWKWIQFERETTGRKEQTEISLLVSYEPTIPWRTKTTWLEHRFLLMFCIRCYVISSQ